MKKILEGKALEEKALKLGCDIQGELITQSASGRHKRASDAELQRRVIEAERSIRESKIWILALLSAIASILSAIAAIIAIMQK